jgi:PAS domain S-box-containing protein
MGARATAGSHDPLLRLATDPSIAAGEPESAARLLARLAADALGVARASVWLATPGGSRLECLALYLRDSGAYAEAPPLESARYPAYFAAYQSGRAIDASDAIHDERTREMAGDHLAPMGVASLLGSPIRLEDRIRGAVCLEHVGEPRVWTADEIAFAAQAADQLALALAAQARREGESRYRTYVCNSTEAMCRIEFDGPVPLDLPPPELVRLVYRHGWIAECNDAFANLHRRPSAEDVVGRRLREVRDGDDPANAREDRALAQARFRAHNALGVSTDRAGRPRRVLNNVLPVEEDGMLVRLWVSGRDVTEETDARDLYAELVDALDGVVWRSDPDTGAFTFVSRQAERILGHRLADWTRPGFWPNHIHSDDRAWVLQSRADALARREPESIEYRMMAADGRAVWVKDSFTLHYRSLVLTSLQGVMIDITRDRDREDAFRALAAKHVAVREEERTRIAREIHDELGQQLTALNFDLATLARAVGPSDPIARMLEGVAAASSAVRRISTDLRPSVLDHFGLAAAIEFQAGEFARRTGIACDIDRLDETQATPETATAVFRIFQEALTNIAKHAGADRVSVELRLDGPNISLAVRDNGRGIAGANLRGKGSLGILGMKERARSVGGRVAMESEPGRGTTVRGWFPAS